jgi:hypothetical protein
MSCLVWDEGGLFKVGIVNSCIGASTRGAMAVPFSCIFEYICTINLLLAPQMSLVEGGTTIDVVDQGIKASSSGGHRP